MQTINVATAGRYYFGNMTSSVSKHVTATKTDALGGEHDHIASDLFNIHVVTEFSRDVIILTYNGCVLKLNR